MILQQAAVGLVVAVALSAASGAAASPGETARVIVPQASIRAEPVQGSAVVTTARQGAVLEIVARAGVWYRVMTAPDARGTRQAGYILAAQVAVEGAAGRGPSAGQPAKPGTSSPAARPPAKKPSRFTLRGVGAVEYEFLQSSRSFKAVFGDARALLAGGGGEISIGTQFFVQARAARVTKKGERVYVFEGEVFPLGIEDKVTMTPIDVSAGYRLPTMSRIRPYVAGGVGALRYRETSEFEDTAEKGNFLSYHVAGGIELPLTKWLAVAGEAQYRTVPGGLGTGGVGHEFSETNLGGTSVCVKVLLGRQPPRRVRPPKPVVPPPKR